ncbi:hypothetical protein DPM13_17465 [Paracoccus mutanolyticus]|uniref:Uncharacterized protein n=1 Tax=Paracoccus mutanolyticus TaxID=1499308 RepID=A0ABN5M835_9RHOB|nr:hypothetical protein DPM13_17465 [Paracoccus mutanolyticus]
MTARNWTDPYLRVDFDMSRVTWVMTTNAHGTAGSRADAAGGGRPKGMPAECRGLGRMGAPGMGTTDTPVIRSFRA